MTRVWGALRGIVVLALAACTGLAGAQQAAAPATGPIPLEAFFDDGKMWKTELSPGGRYLASLTDMPGKPKGLLVIDLEDAKAATFLPISEVDDLVWFRWVSDDWLVGGLFNRNNRSAEYHGDGLVAISRDGKTIRTLIGRYWDDTPTNIRKRWLDPDHEFMALGPPGSNEVIVGQYIFRDTELIKVVPKVLNILTSGVRELDGNAPESKYWTFDYRGRARLAYELKDGESIVRWADTQGKWREIRRSPELAVPWEVVGVDGDDGLLVSTSAPGDGSLELRRFNFATGKPFEETLLTTPGFDTGVAVIHSRQTGKVLGFTVTTDASSQVWLEESMRQVQKVVDGRFRRTVNLLSCNPCDGTGRVVVFAYSDVDPGTFAMYLPKTQQWQLIGEARPRIDPRRMAPVEFVRSKARDGADLPVWITRPRTPAGQKPAALPAVVLVHGGPWLRGREWSWGDGEAQFLASRGYVVIEPEFRGSEGYGEGHFRAGWKQYGLKMQDDISDALKLAVDKGWALPGKACIMGGSYGGYAALMGLAKEPDQYRCGIAIAAVTDPRHLFEFHWSDISAASRQYSLKTLVGDPKKDEAQMIATSPVAQAAKIKAPLLLVHGGLDRRVPMDNAKRMRAALEKEGKLFEWVHYPNAGHGFYLDEDKFDYYRRVEAFLAKHLKN